jgi:hypothetical protein
MRKTLCTWLAVAWLSLLAACGGGGSAPAQVAARSGSAIIGAEGGTVDAVLEGGTTVTMTVPAGALPGKTTFQLDPLVAPAGTLGSLAIAPAGLQFRLPATLSVTLTSGVTPAAGTVIGLEVAGTRIPISAPVDVATRHLSVDLNYLGTGAAAPVASALGAASTRESPMAAVPGTNAVQIDLLNLDYEGRVALLLATVDQLKSQGTRDNAIDTELVMEGVLGDPNANTDQRVRGAVTSWKSVVCGQQQFAVSSLNSFSFASDYAGFLQRAQDVLVWGRLAGTLGTLAARLANPSEAGCANLPTDISEPVRLRFPEFLQAVRSALGLLDPRVDFVQLLNSRVSQLVTFTANLQTLEVSDLDTEVEGLIGEQTVRLRAGAYDACRLAHDQKPQQMLLTNEVGSGVFNASSPYGENDLIDDIQFCGFSLRWTLLDAQGTALEAGLVQGVSPGVKTSTATLKLAGVDKIVFSGPSAALICPKQSQNNEQLGFTVGPNAGPLSSVAVVSPSGSNLYLELSPLNLDVANLVTKGDDLLLVARTGGVCSGDFVNLTSHATLATFKLDRTSVRITSTSLPTGTIGTSYVAGLTLAGGAAPFTWSATGLPPGLSVDPQTGAIGGVPTQAGTTIVAFGVASADQSNALVNIPLTVSVPAPPNVAGTYVGTNIDNTSANPVPQSFFTVVTQSSNVILVGGAGGNLLSMAPNGDLTYLGEGGADFSILVPAADQPGKSVTGSLVGRHLHLRRVLCCNSRGQVTDDNTFDLDRQ